MSSDQRSLEEIVRDLPPESQAKVRQFVELLRETTNGEKPSRAGTDPKTPERDVLALEDGKVKDNFDIYDNMTPAEANQIADMWRQKKAEAESNKRLEQNWAGALSDYREKYTSMDLQERSLEWRGD